MRTLASFLSRRMSRETARRLPRRLGVPVLEAKVGGRQSVADVRSIPLAAGLRLDVYWVQLDGGAGPAASVYALGEELMRIDLFADRPHIHYGVAESRWCGPGRPSVRWPVAGWDDLIGRAQFELTHNLAYSLACCYRPAVRRLAPALDPEALQRAAGDMGRHMRDLLSARAGAP